MTATWARRYRSSGNSARSPPARRSGHGTGRFDRTGDHAGARSVLCGRCGGRLREFRNTPAHRPVGAGMEKLGLHPLGIALAPQDGPEFAAALAELEELG